MRNVRQWQCFQPVPDSAFWEVLHAHKDTIFIRKHKYHLQRLQQKTIILLSVIKRIFEFLLVLSETRAFNAKTHNKWWKQPGYDSVLTSEKNPTLKYLMKTNYTVRKQKPLKMACRNQQVRDWPFIYKKRTFLYPSKTEPAHVHRYFGTECI